jgi:hypothetical protein
LVKILPPPKLFFSLENQKIFEYNFNTATHSGHKKHIFFNRVAQLLASKGSKSTFWAISPVFTREYTKCTAGYTFCFVVVVAVVVGATFNQTWQYFS